MSESLRVERRQPFIWPSAGRVSIQIALGSNSRVPSASDADSRLHQVTWVSANSFSRQRVCAWKTHGAPLKRLVSIPYPKHLIMLCGLRSEQALDASVLKGEAAKSPFDLMADSNFHRYKRQALPQKTYR